MENITLLSKNSEDYLTHVCNIQHKKILLQKCLNAFGTRELLINIPHIVLIMIQLQSQCQRKTRISILKIIIRNYLFHLQLMLILNG